MLTKKQFFILFLATFLPFFVYFFRPDLMGADGYYFLAGICQMGVEIETPPLFYLVLQGLPCNILVLKALLFCCCFGSVLALASMGRLYSEKHGWKAGLMGFLSPLMVFEFAKFENDAFGYVFLFWAAYFFLRGLAEGNKWKNYSISLLLIFISCGFWYGGLFYLIAFSVSSLFFLCASLGFVFAMGKKLLTELVGLEGVSENEPGIGLAYLFGLNLCFTKAPREIFPLLVIFYLVATVNSKFAILAVPFAVVGFLHFFEWIKWEQVKEIIPYVCFSLAIAWGFSLLLLPPLPHYWQAIDYAVDLNAEVQNDWSFGHWVEWRGGEPLMKGAPVPAIRFGGGIVLTQHPLEFKYFLRPNHCEFLKQFRDINIYRCAQ